MRQLTTTTSSSCCSSSTSSSSHTSSSSRQLMLGRGRPFVANARPPARRVATTAAAAHDDDTSTTQRQQASTTTTSRRSALLLGAAAAAAAAAGAGALPLPAPAVQGLTAGRIPGLTPEPDGDGFYTYTRPEGKSGGHGVGWSELPRYSFKVPDGWEETPVSIADLGGTEIDLRFASSAVGSLQVVVAPVLRFADIGFNADVRIDQLNGPDAIISGFAPELFGRPLDDGDVLQTDVVDKQGIRYYEWALKPHNYVSATAVGNRVFILSVAAKSSRSWAKHQPELRRIQQSFWVPPKGAGSA